MERPYYCVELEGENISDLLSEVKIEESDSRADMATLRFPDNELVLIDLLQEGQKIEIDLGYSNAHAIVFRGNISSVRPNIPSEGQPHIEVEAMNSLMRLALQPKTYLWTDTTVSQIVHDIAIDHELRLGQVQPAYNAEFSETHPKPQVETMDLAFLYSLADDYGSRLFVQYDDIGDTLNFVSVEKLLEANALNTPLVFNENLESFSITADSFAASPPVAVTSTDASSGEPTPSSSSEVDTSQGRWTPDADRIAQLEEGLNRISRLVARTAIGREQPGIYRQTLARLVGAPARLESDLSQTFGNAAQILGQSGIGQTKGSYWLHPRRMVQIEGYGGRWSGVWYLSEVDHLLDVQAHRYTTSFTCTR